MSRPEAAANPILVLGAGPAGGAVALGLKRLGYEVTVVTQPRPFRALEGISERVVEGLRHAGFVRALQQLPPPTPRLAEWNGQASAANTERLIDRSRFDRALLEDLKAAGVGVIEGRVLATAKDGAGHRVQVREGDTSHWLTTPFLVEARGRAAPAAGQVRCRGRDTLSLLQYWRGPRLAARSAAQSFDSGWAWMAAAGEGRYLQLTLDVETSRLPAKAGLGDFCRARLEGLTQAAPFLQEAEPSGQVQARISTPVLYREAVGDNWIRVGDAAMAVDPLSGNGIFQALSSALQAPAVINTLLRRPRQGHLARAFYQSRLDHLFTRFARIGRDFYRMEASFTGQPFWQARRQWPDQEPLHPAPDPESLRIARRPVISDDFIVEARVVVSNDHPLGRWHLGGIELALQLEALRERARRAARAVASS